MCQRRQANSGGAAVLFGSTRSYTNGSHWRIRNLTVGYTLDRSLARRVAANTLRLYVTAQDPYVFTNYKGYDPENGTAGGSPMYRTILFGGNVGF